MRLDDPGPDFDLGPQPADRLRVAVCGEVNAGKSTVLNTLLRARVLPDNLGRRHRPVVFVGHRAAPGTELQQPDGQRLSLPPGSGAADIPEAVSIRLWSDHRHLAGLELIELPLTRAEELTPAHRAVIGACDVMVWVTIASQAWRLTEKQIVERLAWARPERGILAVTRGDKLRSDVDRAKLMERMQRETAPYFATRLFINGARRLIEEAAGSDEAWGLTGGAGLARVLQGIARPVLAERASASGGT